MITPEIATYIKCLVSKFQGIQEIWLLGSRANNNFRSDSDWDLIAFSDNETFNQIKSGRDFKNPIIDLMVVFNGVDFEEPWPDLSEDRPTPKHGSLKGISGWEWNRISETEATYKGAKDLPNGSTEIKTKKAVKVWP